MDSNTAPSRFSNATGQITVWPSKQRNQLVVLAYLSTKFDHDRSYSEKEINTILNHWHTFGDWAILRRSLVDNGFMSRHKDGSNYILNRNRT